MMETIFDLLALRLHTLMTEGLISEFTFVFIPETSNDLQGSKQVPPHCQKQMSHMRAV